MIARPLPSLVSIGRGPSGSCPRGGIDGLRVWAAYWGDKPFPEAYPDYSPGTLP